MLTGTTRTPAFKEGEPVLPIVDRKPEYQMADELPLVLWDCAYSDEDTQWQIDKRDWEDRSANGTGGVRKQFDPDTSTFVSPPFVQSVSQRAFGTIFPFSRAVLPSWMPLMLSSPILDTAT